MKLPQPIHATWVLTRDSVRDFVADSALPRAGAIAFYAMLSLAPLLVVIIAIAGAVWGAQAARGEIVGQFRSLMGEDAARMIEDIIVRAGQQKSGGIAATVFGAIVLLVGAIGVFGQIKSTLNAVWNVERRSAGGIWPMVRDYLLSFAMVLCVAFLLLVSLAVNAALSAMGGWLSQLVQIPPAVMWVINMVIAIGVITLLFAAMYKWLPDVRIAWRDVWIGALVTSILFNLGKFLIGFYLGHSSTVSVYGAAGSLVMILLWVYYSSVIFLLGAEFTQAYARWSGSPIVPAETAQPRSAEAASARNRRKAIACPADDRPARPTTVQPA